MFPGDRLRCRIEILDATPSRSKPFMGSVRSKCQVLNQNGDVVMSLIGIGLFRSETGMSDGEATPDAKSARCSRHAA